MASSAPSPITTVPSIAIASKALRMASIAATSAPISSPRPMSRAEASAAASRLRVLDGLELLLRVACGAALGGRLDGQEEKVALGQRAQPVLGFAAEVRVGEAGGARHRDLLEPRQHAEAVFQEEGGDHR